MAIALEGGYARFKKGGADKPAHGGVRRGRARDEPAEERWQPATKVRDQRKEKERATGVEPATSSLGSWHSTTELRPRRAPCLAHGARGGNASPIDAVPERRIRVAG